MREIPETYEVHIGAFEGPMDLLLYLVQQSEVKIADISIAEIADQYLLWIKDLSQMDLSQAGDFLVMASRLMAMKTRELLPKEERSAEDEEAIDLSRDEFIRQMLEYQRYKQVAKEMQEMENGNFGTCYRGRLEKTESEDDTLADANVWQLFRAYQKMLKFRGNENVHHIELDDVTIEDRQQFISNTLRREGRVLFEDLLGRDPLPIVTVVTFMALMEMIKTDEVVFRQSELFGAIWIYRKKDNSEFAEEMANETRLYEPEHAFKAGIVEKLRERELLQGEKSGADKRVPLDQALRTVSALVSKGKVFKDDDVNALLAGELDIESLEAELAAENAPEAEPEAESATEIASAVESAEIGASLAENVEPTEEIARQTEKSAADAATDSSNSGNSEASGPAV